MKNYTEEEMNILNEKRNYLLSLRKKRINLKINEQRFKNINIQNENQIINNEMTNMLDKEKNYSYFKNIKSKFEELLTDKANNEEKYLSILKETFENIENFIKNYNLNFLPDQLIDPIMLENLINDLIIKKFINNNEIINWILIVFSCLIFIYNQFPNTNKLKQIFISKDQYINLYISFFQNINDEEIIYNACKFFGLLAKNSDEIMMKLYNEKVLEIILNNDTHDGIIEVMQVKLWCISQFELNVKINENINIILKI